MSDQITYDDKADLIVDTTIDDIFKVSASDMNEIKNVVNSHADDIDVANNNITDLNNNKLDINEVLNQASTDTDKPYSADYLNDKLVSVGTTAPENGERVWFAKSKNLWGGFTFSKIVNGVNFTQNSDGSITMTGTATATALSILSAEANTNGILKTLPAGTYVVSGGRTGMQVQVLNSSGTNLVSTPASGTASFTLNEPTSVFVRVAITNGAETNTTLEIQLEEGTTATTYEPYVEEGIYVDGEELYNPNNSEKYSTSEIKIGTWIDGKTLYRKVVNIGALPNSSTKQVAHNISNMGSVVSLRGMVTDGRFFPIPYCATTNAYAISLFADKTNITVITGSDRSSVTGFAIIEYTKTTD
jgi:hypothetical protein